MKGVARATYIVTCDLKNANVKHVYRCVIIFVIHFHILTQCPTLSARGSTQLSSSRRFATTTERCGFESAAQYIYDLQLVIEFCVIQFR